MRGSVLVAFVGVALCGGCQRPRSEPPLEAYVVEVPPDKAGRWLSWWSWSTGADAKPVALTKFCDWIFERSDGTVHRLSVQDGSVEHLSASRKELTAALAADEARERHLRASSVHRAERAGKTLMAGQCCSYVLPPGLGGTSEESNVRATDIGGYQLVMVQLTQLLKLVPKGTATNRLRMDFRPDGTLDLLVDGVSLR